MGICVRLSLNDRLRDLEQEFEDYTKQECYLTLDQVEAIKKEIAQIKESIAYKLENMEIGSHIYICHGDVTVLKVHTGWVYNYWADGIISTSTFVPEKI